MVACRRVGVTAIHMPLRQLLSFQVQKCMGNDRSVSEVKTAGKCHLSHAACRMAHATGNQVSSKWEVANGSQMELTIGE